MSLRHFRFRCLLTVSLILMPLLASADDGRELVEMPERMQAHMLKNMRDHLAALNEIITNMVNGKWNKAAEIAEWRLGMSSLESHGAKHMSKHMPEGMRAVGLSMHRAASRLALRAEEAEADPAYSALAEVTAACVACHTSYRIR